MLGGSLMIRNRVAEVRSFDDISTTNTIALESLGIRGVFGENDANASKVRQKSFISEASSTVGDAEQELAILCGTVFNAGGDAEDRLVVIGGARRNNRRIHLRMVALRRGVWDAKPIVFKAFRKGEVVERLIPSRSCTGLISIKQIDTIYTTTNPRDVIHVKDASLRSDERLRLAGERGGANEKIPLAKIYRRRGLTHKTTG
jgi:hypothetical protein